jgi:hypothetical protein
VWERTVDSLEDTDPWTADHLLDPALHGADTTTRTQTMAQIKWSPRPFLQATLEDLPRIGDALLTVALRAGQGGAADPCDPCAKDVEVPRRTGNYLFRVEVHDVQVTSPALTKVILKWSSENGAEQYRIDTGPKPVDTVPGSFKSGDHVYEFYNDESEKHLGVHLAPFTPTRGKLYDAYPPSLPAGFDRVRRWDGYAELSRKDQEAWSLAKGWDRGAAFQTSAEGAKPGDFQVTDGNFVFHLQALDLTLTTRRDPKEGPPPFRLFVAGDYWLAPVREIAHEAGDKVLENAPPIGIRHHYLRLADVTANTVQDLDKYREQHLKFPPLTDIKAVNVDYEPLCDAPKQLFETKVVGQPVDTVKAALDRLCEIGAQHIAFAETCDSSLYQGVKPKTVAEALHLLCDIRARHVGYKPPDNCQLFQVPTTTTTVADALSRICGISAENVAYTGCPDLKPKTPTVQGALDALCARPSGGGVSCRATVGNGGTYATLVAAVKSIDSADDNVALCLCLLPGGHPVDEVLTVTGSGTRAVNLTICGCGRASRILLGKTGRLNFVGLRSLRMENLLLLLDPPPTTDVPAQLIARDGFEVTLEGVIVTGSARPAGAQAPVSLQASLSVRVAACRFEILSSAGLATVGNLFTPINPALGELFSPQLDDDAFEARQQDVAPALVAFPPKRRSVLASGITTALAQPPVPITATLRDCLQRFADTITLPTPEVPAVASCLDDVRSVALSSIPALALVLGSAAGDTTLVDNQILGVVSIYGEPGGGGLTFDQIVGLQWDERCQPANGNAIKFASTAGRLSVDRNEISRLTFAGTKQAQLVKMTDRKIPGETLTGIYRAAFLAQNRFTFGGNQVLAKDVRLTDNLFEPVDQVLGVAIAETAIYHGNGSVEFGNFSFFNLTRRHNAETRGDLNTLVIR